MEFPPTPEAEPKNKTNAGTKKTKKKKKLTITGEEQQGEGEGQEDLRTLETLDELKARLKANYLEAKKQREKYLNLSREQTSEEKRAKSLRGTRKCTEDDVDGKNNAKNVTATDIGGGDVENVTALAATLQSELESRILKNNGGSSSSSRDVSRKSLNFDDKSDIASDITTADATNSPRKSMTGEKTDSTSRMTVDVYMGPTTSSKKPSALREDVYLGPTPQTSSKDNSNSSKIDSGKQNADVLSSKSPDIVGISTMKREENSDYSMSKFAADRGDVKKEVVTADVIKVTSLRPVLPVEPAKPLSNSNEVKVEEKEEEVEEDTGVITNDNTEFNMDLNMDVSIFVLFWSAPSQMEPAPLVGKSSQLVSAISRIYDYNMHSRIY